MLYYLVIESQETMNSKAYSLKPLWSDIYSKIAAPQKCLGGKP